VVVTHITQQWLFELIEASTIGLHCNIVKLAQTRKESIHQELVEEGLVLVARLPETPCCVPGLPLTRRRALVEVDGF
jgi:hypothetical protein